MKKLKNKKTIIIGLGLFMICGLFMGIQIVKGAIGDTSGDISGSGSGCGGQDSCWIYIDGVAVTVGMRVTVVNSAGQMVSARSVDYLQRSGHTDKINANSNYYRCVNNNRNKISYLKGYSSCNWAKHDRTNIAKTLSWMPQIYNDASAAGTIRNKITSMDVNELKSTFFNDIGYTLPDNKEQRENNYLLIEPLSLVTINGSGSYYGTFYELASRWYGKITWVSSVLNRHMPLSLYIEGNSAIGGDGGFKNGAYFNGTLQAIQQSYTEVYNGNKRVKKAYMGQNYGWGIGIYWIPGLNIPDPKPPKCEYNNSSHFSNTTSGPNGEDCCQYVMDHQSEYGVNKSQLFAKYPRCRANIVKNCAFSLSTTNPKCGTSAYGYVKDIKDWDCIYASAFSSDSSVKNYFLKYGSPTSGCSVYCRDEIEYFYPGNGMVALAGNYFTIGTSLNDYSYYIDSSTNTTRVRAASLGPVEATIKRQCSILGSSNSTCEAKRNEELNKLDSNSPQVEFSYQSKYYNNPVENLTSKLTNSSSNTSGSIKQKQVTYTYSLPNSTYKYVSKNTGISHKVTSTIGMYPYINIGNHSPIHFSEKSDSTPFQLTIKKFNMPNFDSLVLGGKTMSTNFVTSIETYIQTLIKKGNATPRNINGIYYLDQTFINLLNKNNYSADQFLAMSCANTSKYTCNNNANGIYCYDKNTTSNSEQTYKNLEICIDQKVAQLTSDKASYKNKMLYSCNFKVKNPSPDPKETGINVIFRPISLDNPFPGYQSAGRQTGGNWCYGINCNNNNTVVQNSITNNRGVKTEEVYKKLDPLYTITLTPGLIKEIRSYNDKNDYDDFKLTCYSDGSHCLSQFIRNKYTNYFKGCGINNKKSGLDCQPKDSW